MRAFVVSLALLLSGCASLRDSTHAVTGIDAATSAAGIASGLAVEANPLMVHPGAFVGVMIARAIATEHVNSMPEPARTAYLSAMSSVWIAPGVSNALIIAGASGPIGLAAGLMVGVGWWVSTADRRLFAHICAAEMTHNHALICDWKS